MNETRYIRELCLACNGAMIWRYKPEQEWFCLECGRVWDNGGFLALPMKRCIRGDIPFLFVGNEEEL